MLEQLLEYLTVASRSTAAITNYVCLVVKDTDTIHIQETNRSTEDGPHELQTYIPT